MELENCSDLNETTKTPPIENVGEEFIQWAEKCWALKTHLSQDNLEGESCSYNYMREIFVNKINKLVEEKIRQE